MADRHGGPLSATVFLVNPASANGATGRRWPEIAQAAARAGLRGDTLFSERPGHIGDLAREAVAGGASLLVVFGGDGTLNEAVDGLLRAGVEGVELALVPRGTGDDFARTFGLPKGLAAALEVAASGTARPVDAGRARFLDWDSSSDERHFANFGGVGISGAIARRGAATSRRLGARLAYLWATVAVFARWSSVETTVDADNERRQEKMFEVLVSNGAYAAGGMHVAPDASADDGLFDVVLFGDFTKAEFTTTFPKIYRGTHVHHPKVEVVRARTVYVDAATPLPVVLDGEQPGTTPASFEILPGALRLRLPA